MSGQPVFPENPSKGSSQDSSPTVQSGFRHVLPVVAAVIILLVLAVVAVNWISKPTIPLQTVAENPPEDHSTGGEPSTFSTGAREKAGFLGPQACAECHQQRVTEFMETNHFRTCRQPVVADLPPGFEPGRGTYHTRFPGVRFEMNRKGDQIFQTTIRTTGATEEKIDTRIDLILGAGQADDVYLAWHDDGRLHELPVAWLWPFDQWGASHFLHADGRGDFSRAMTVRCMECHTTWLDYEPGSVNKYGRESIIPGVTCERCHGPGRDHVAFRRAHRQQGDGDDPIVLPSELERERLIETCTQCHSNATLHRRPPYSYRPGERLEDYYRTLAVAHSEDDHVANQIDRLRLSKCFQNSPTMTCVTCHDPHHRPKANESASASCLQCHQPPDCEEQARLPNAVQGECVACHMPRRIKINVKFETETDNFMPPTTRSVHRIAVDPIARDEVLLKWHRSQNGDEHQTEARRLADSLTEYWKEQTTAMRQQHRYMAAIAAAREVKQVDSTPESQNLLNELITIQEKIYTDWAKALSEIDRNRPQQAIDLLKSLLVLKPEDAEMHSKLGTLYAMTGQTELARQHLELVEKFDPNNPSGRGVLGRIEWLEGHYAEALEHWRLASSLEPFNAQLHYDIGAALLKLKQTEAGFEHLRTAGEIDPNRPEFLVLLVNGLAEAGRRDEAIRAAEESFSRPWSQNNELMNAFRLRIEQLRAESIAE